MRAALLFSIVLVAAGCESDPTIACNTDDQCLSGQRCATGICRTAGDTTTPDANGDSSIDATSNPFVDAAIDAAPVMCTPACSGATPYCVGGSCVQCRNTLDCPITAPTCSSSHTCTL